MTNRLSIIARVFIRQSWNASGGHRASVAASAMPDNQWRQDTHSSLQGDLGGLRPSLLLVILTHKLLCCMGLSHVATRQSALYQFDE